MPKEISIEKYLNPNDSELIISDGLASASMMDMELDPMELEFNCDGCVQINTDDYAYITLHPSHLYKLIRLIEQSDAYYENQSE